MTWKSLGLAAVVGSCLLVLYHFEKEKKLDKRTREGRSAGKPAIGGPWILVNHNGIPVTDASYRGQYCLLYFGFTRCPDICPSELVKVGKVVDAVGMY